MTHFSRDPAFEDLWNTRAELGPPFTAEAVADLPEPARRYLTHAVAPGTPRASAVRLSMHGEIKLGNWHPFVAEEVIAWDRGFVWRAKTTLMGLPVTGSDRWIDGAGSMRWKLLGLIPVMVGAGPDISRSALGRVQIEATLLPSVLLAPDVVWHPVDATHVDASLRFQGQPARISLEVDEAGGLKSMCMPRWGNPDRGANRLVPFGGFVDREVRFGGHTIPAQLRLGWYFGSDRFEPEGEFFRVTIDDAVFR